jgi:hypothetical protein
MTTNLKQFSLSMQSHQERKETYVTKEYQIATKSCLTRGEGNIHDLVNELETYHA